MEGHRREKRDEGSGVRGALVIRPQPLNVNVQAGKYKFCEVLLLMMCKMCKQLSTLTLSAEIPLKGNRAINFYEAKKKRVSVCHVVILSFCRVQDRQCETIKQKENYFFARQVRKGQA